jgi:LAS superfamily LD-carboxypeptidase LdcB
VSATVRSLDARVQPFVSELLRALARAGIKAELTSTRRDLAEQRRLYDCYRRTGCSNCRRGPGCFPAAPPGSSTHATGFAFDVRLTPPVYAELGQVWEQLGLTWGGRFKDPIHFDFRPFRS